jgi:hypothetical protein
VRVTVRSLLGRLIRSIASSLRFPCRSTDGLRHREEVCGVVSCAVARRERAMADREERFDVALVIYLRVFNTSVPCERVSHEGDLYAFSPSLSATALALLFFDHWRD